MERINLVELLKDCIGMELDCAIFNDVTLYGIDASPENEYPIRIETKSGNFLDLTKYGTYSNIEEAKCVIFPKGKTTWEGFQRPFKDGDILSYQCAGFRNRTIYIYRHHPTLNTSYYVALGGDLEFMVNPKEGHALSGNNTTARLATENEKEKLFQAIKDKGYKWNAETKTLEKLSVPKFKDGDILYCNANDNGEDKDMFKYIFIFDKIVDGRFYYSHCHLFGSEFYDTKANLVHDYSVRFATEEEKARLFDAIEENGYKWNPETKMLEKLVVSKEDTENKTVMSGIYFDRENYADEVELHLNNYEIEIRDGKTYAVYKNPETKTLENLNEPEFKVGDRIKKKDSNGDVVLITYIADNDYIVETKYGMETAISISNQNNYELVSDKFNINTLVPFESRVLVRQSVHDIWKPAYWGKYDKNVSVEYPFITSYGSVRYCIPYKDNEHLLGKTDDCDEFYRTWEKTRD